MAARQGPTRLGMVRHGQAWPDWARLGRHGRVRRGAASHGGVGQGRRDPAWQGTARQGLARHGAARLRQGR